jgi:hypothetical protein
VAAYQHKVNIYAFCLDELIYPDVGLIITTGLAKATSFVCLYRPINGTAMNLRNNNEQ